MSEANTEHTVGTVVLVKEVKYQIIGLGKAPRLLMHNTSRVASSFFLIN